MSRAAHRILKVDPVMAGIIGAVSRHRIGHVSELATLQERSPYESLARAIAHQQLNGKAAQSILTRVESLFGQRFPTPEELLAADPQQIRGAGFSFAKIAALQDLAAKTLAGVVPSIEVLEPLSDLEIIERLTTVRGIGRWTVEMMLIFQLRRPDVLPVDDFGICNGFRLAYGLSGMPHPRALAEFGERWKPHRSVAAWYLWRAVELELRGVLPRCSRPPRIAMRKLAGKVATLARRVRQKVSKARAASRGKRKSTAGRTTAPRRAAAGDTPARRANARRTSARRTTALGLLATLLMCWGAHGRTAQAADLAPPSAVHDDRVAQSAHVGIDASVRGRVFAHDVIVTANPLATLAGYRVLQAGGTAADAAVAVQAVLGLVEPQASGLGGGGFITFYDAHSHQVLAYDGREKAPAGATSDMFEDSQGQPLPFFTAVLSGRSCGVPGAIAALARLQREHGRLPWHALFGDAERLASDGFTVSPRLAMMISLPVPQASTPDARRYFTRPDGARYAAGDVLRNPDYAATIHLLAAQGPRALYEGRIAADIVARVHEGALPGTLSLADLSHYRAEETPALCRRWQQARICEAPPPGGGIAVLEGLLLLEHTDIAQRGPHDPIAWVELAQAQRLMYADRDHYIGDPSFVSVPIEGLLDTGYVKQRATLIGSTLSPMPPAPGHPRGAHSVGPDHTVEPGGTSEFIIVDRAGNVVSMTTTVESIFGDGRMVDGFFLNNQLTDFSFSPRDRDGQPAANAVAPGKRPRSAMSPTLVFDAQGRFLASTGSAGGPAIIAYVMKTLIGVLDWHLSMQAAIDLPNLVATGPRISGEAGFPASLLAGLAAHGLTITPSRFEGSGIQGVLAQPDGSLEGAADPRREGIALGD